MSLKARLLIAVITLVVINVLIMGISSVNLAVSNATEMQLQASKNKLQNLSYQSAQHLALYFQSVEQTIRNKSRDRTMIEAVRGFIPAFNGYAIIRGGVTAQQVQRLEDFYQRDFTQAFASQNGFASDRDGQFITRLAGNGLALQHDYLAATDLAIDNKGELIHSGISSSYTTVHQKFHPGLRRFQQEFGYDDVLIAEVLTGNVVYSTNKDSDFATSVLDPRYQNTGIAEVFNRAANSGNESDVFFSAFSAYLPALNRIQGFVASPVQANGELVAILIFKLSVAPLNKIFSYDGQWQKRGLGGSGETLLVDINHQLLNEPRQFIQSPAMYLARLRGLEEQTARARNSVVGLIAINSQDASLGLDGQTGFIRFTDQQQEILSAYVPLNVGQQRFVVITRMQEQEAFAGLKDIHLGLITSAALVILLQVLIAVFVANWFARKLVNPLSVLGETCQSLTKREGDLTIQLNASGVAEIDKITDNLNTFIGQIRLIISQVKEDADELAAASHQLKQVTTESESVTMQQRTQTNNVATSIRELSQSIHAISDSAHDTSTQSLEAQNSLQENMQRAELAAENIKLLVELLHDSSDVIANLKHEVNEITNMLGVITSIADQTNLLALNAAIEAARAGDAGRGFSVVADEVRALAQRSQDNTEQIAKLVDVMTDSSQKSVEKMERAATAADGGIHLVDLVSTAMDELGANLKRVMDMTAKVSTTTDYQNATSDFVISNVEQINKMAEDVEQGAHQTSEAAMKLANIAAHAQSLVARFKV